MQVLQTYTDKSKGNEGALLVPYARHFKKLGVSCHLKELVCVLGITFTPVSLFSEQREVQLSQQCAITVQSLLAEFSRNHILLIGFVTDSLGVGSEEVDQLVEQRLSLQESAVALRVVLPSLPTGKQATQRSEICQQDT